MPPTRIHHINFVVRDLDEAMPRFQKALGLDPFTVIEHRPRGAQIARSKIGESWLVLVCPYDPDSVPGQHLARHGEGFFMLSVGYDDIVKQLERLEASGVQVTDRKPREGILDWQIADIGDVHGALFQLTQDDSGNEED